jgi:hypothetical protein
MEAIEIGWASSILGKKDEVLPVLDYLNTIP